MRKTAWLTLVILALATVGITRLTRPGREFTTTSDEAYTLYERGDEQCRAFQWAPAEVSLRKALQLDPGFAMAKAALADLYSAMGRRDLSMRTAVSADSLARLLPDKIERWTVQLRLSNLERPFIARRDSLYALLEPRRPRSLFVLISRANMASARHDRAGEIAAWQEVLRVDPNYAAAYNQLGYLSAREGRYDEAKSYLKKYAFLAPQLANPHDSLGEILSYCGEYEEAGSELKQALTLQPDFFPSLINLGLVFIEQGQVHKGIEVLEKVRSQIAGTEWEKRVDGILMQTYYDLDLRPQLVSAMERWIDRYPTSWQTNFYRSLDLLNARQWAAAEAAADTFVAVAKREPLYPLFPSFQKQVAAMRHVLSAMAARERGDHATAAAEYEQALALQKDYSPHEQWPVKYRYARELLALGRNEDALAQTSEILKYNPRRLRVLLLETRAELALGRQDDARATLGRLDQALSKADRDLAIVATADSLTTALGVKPNASPGLSMNSPG